VRSDHKPASRKRRLAVLALLPLGLLIFSTSAPAADIGALQARVDDARAQAGALASQLEADQAQLLVARQEAAVALAREQALTALLAVGERRAAELGASVVRSRRNLAIEKRRLRRARAALAGRLLAVYRSGSPDVAELILSSDGFEDLIASVDYVRSIEEADTRLAIRVEQVRDAVRAQLAAVREAKARADAYNARLASARAEISSVRAAAASEAAELQAVAASRMATIETLRANVGGWVEDIQAARAAAERAASEAAAQEQLSLWLGGPYSIPAYIVMCESGGNYGAVNPSSGAGGAYQILPSTWDLYGGEGAPQDASKHQQDQIAAQIWADSGPGAWVCAG
jgi:septal ring factor EnvC (AmiA/AmiB activator)